MTIKILQKNSPILHQRTTPVPRQDITSKKIQDIIRKMSDALYHSENGVGIAAPQLGIGVSIFIVSEEAVAYKKNDGEQKKDRKQWKHFVFINPKLIKKSKKKELLHEGCLSIRGIFGSVQRSKQVIIEAHNEHGEKKRIGASGLFAQVLQHELDHLDGVLFIDKAEVLEKEPT